MRRDRIKDHRDGYVLRSQLCLVAALVMAIATVQLWPLPQPDDDEPRTYRRGQETIEIDEIVQTKQRQKTPPPPPPVLPVEVSDDEIIDDVELDLPEDFLALSEDDGEGQIGPEGTARSAPELLEPRPVRIVEPEYTRDARRKKIRAEVVIEVLVDERGRVKEAKVVERFLLGKDEEREQVNHLGFGLEESAIDAAERWMFRPARHGGQAVRAYTTLRFSFGV